MTSRSYRSWWDPARRVELESRLQRSIVSWILAAQGVTLAATSLLVTVFAFTLG